MDFVYIDTDQQLLEYCKQSETSSYCSIDTEFVREKTYFPILALIQVATEQGMACIDPLKINDFGPLLSLFQNENMLKILHSPSQDMDLFHHYFNTLPKPVFDTQLAAAVLGYANQIGYADLVNRIRKVQLEKKYTRTDWSKRPLSEGELDYAMDDVRYLLPVYQHLSNELEELDRHDWIKADFEKMADLDTYKIDFENLWKRLKGVQKLKGEALNNADQLCRWRERLAIDKNRPRRWMMKDEDIVDIARFKPASHKEILEIGALSADYVGKNGDAILKVLEKAAAIDSADYPRHPQFTRLNNQQQAVSECLMALSKQITDENRIALASVTGKKEIDRFIISREDNKLMSGWRYELLGRHLENFLSGEMTIRFSSGHLELS